MLLQLLLLVLVAPATPLDANLHLNLHLKLNQEAEGAAISVNNYLTSQCPNNNVSLSTVEQPHVTLYLTEFNSSNPVVQTLTKIAPNIIDPHASACRMGLADIVVTGCYAMWEVVQPNDCLQQASDTVVNATYSFATPNQPIPSWVKQLPEPVRSKKEADIRRYGSPNVFSQFVPHVTVGYDCSPPPPSATSTSTQPTSCLIEAVRRGQSSGKLPVPVSPFVPQILGIGQVGPHGTVLRGKDLKDIVLWKDR